MTKIGLLNFHYSNHNYGAVLQAYALQEITKNFDKEVEHIDYIPIPSKMSLFEKIKDVVIFGIKSIDTLGILVNTPKVHNKSVFENFRNENLKRTDSSYRTISDLYLLKSHYSHVIVGSDQVWRTSYTVENRDVYFLKFCSEKTQRISYAASFGVDYWEYKNDSEETFEVKKEISKFKAVSVREKSGVKICDEVFNVNAVQVLDPTLAIGRACFDKIADKSIYQEDSGVVYYKLDLNKDFINFIKWIETKKGMKAENIYHKKIGIKYYYNSVEDWLSKIRNSKLVITDSFHCICFAILFNKEFLYVSNGVRGLTRLESLLSSLGLENRIAKKNLRSHYSSFCSEKIDYTTVNALLENERCNAIKFIKSALANADNN